MCQAAESRKGRRVPLRSVEFDVLALGLFFKTSFKVNFQWPEYKVTDTSILLLQTSIVRKIQDIFQ